MTFSPEFENALHFIANVDGGKLERMADKIVQEYELDAKNNPKFADGMWVSAYNAYGQFVGVGEVVRSEWDPDMSRYYHDVYIFDNDYITKNVRDDRMQRFVMNPTLSRHYKKSRSTPMEGR